MPTPAVPVIVAITTAVGSSSAASSSVSSCASSPDRPVNPRTSSGSSAGMGTRRRCSGDGCRCRFHLAAQDRPVQPLQLGAGIHAELLGQACPDGGVAVQRLGPVPGRGQRVHQYRRQRLDERVLAGQRGQRPDQRRRVAATQLRLRPGDRPVLPLEHPTGAGRQTVTSVAHANRAAPGPTLPRCPRRPAVWPPAGPGAGPGPARRPRRTPGGPSSRRAPQPVRRRGPPRCGPG